MTTDQQALRRQFKADVDRFISKEENAAVYDIYAKDYERALPKYRAHSHAAAAVKRTYPNQKDLRILDVGAGTGWAGQELHAAGYRNLDALEPSKLMREEAKKKNVYIEFFTDFLGTNRLPIDDNTYDVIVGSGIFAPGHVKEDCFEELVRIVKPGGRIILSNRATHLQDLPNLENGMRQHEEAGRWRMTREVFEDFDEGGAKGVLHLLQVN